MKSKINVINIVIIADIENTLGMKAIALYALL